MIQLFSLVSAPRADNAIGTVFERDLPVDYLAYVENGRRAIEDTVETKTNANAPRWRECDGHGNSQAQARRSPAVSEARSDQRPSWDASERAEAQTNQQT
jgi:hypothetical protein